MRHLFTFFRLLGVVLICTGCPRPPQPTTDHPAASLIHFDGKIALQQAGSVCASGNSRSYESPALQAAQKHILAHLQKHGWRTVRQTFTTSGAAGLRTHTNLIATFPTESVAAKTWVFAATVDAIGSKENSFPAASESAAGCGVLLELAEKLAVDPNNAGNVTLLFFDGEAPVRQFSPEDGLAGSRFYFQTLVENGQADKVRGAIVLGAIGHRNAKWVVPSLTSPDLRELLEKTVQAEGWVDQILPANRPIWGAHLAAIPNGVPALLLHDSNYESLHTAGDTVTNLDAESLRKVGVILWRILQSE